MINYVDIHVTKIKHTEFRKYKTPGPKWRLVDIMGYISFVSKMKNVYFYQEEIHCCTAHKYITETIVNASRPVFPNLFKTRSFFGPV